jgi:hypothetical protein
MNTKTLSMVLSAVTLLTAVPTTACASHVPEPKSEADGPPPGPGGPHHGPPKEAVQACGNLKQGDECRFKMRDEILTGTCEPGPKNEKLACRPQGAPPGPPPRS